MHKIVLWTLVILRALAPASSHTCDSIQGLVEIGSCQEVFGPPINCSAQVFGSLTAMRQLYENLTFYNLRSGKMKFKRMKVAYKMLKKLLKESESFYNILKEGQTHQQKSSGEDCVLMHLFQERISVMETYVDIFSSFKRWIDYYFPVVAGLEFVFGMFGNLVIVVIFIRNEDMRTAPNQVILNLAIGDIFLLITNTVTYYIRYRWLPLEVGPILCTGMSYARSVAIAASVYSMVVLSMLRFHVTASLPTQHFMERFIRIPMLLTFVWAIAAVTGIPEAFNVTIFCEFSITTTTKYLRFICLCLVPLVAIVAFSAATYKTIHRKLPGEQIPNLLRHRRARQRGAKILLCLVVVFCVTYLPLNIYSLTNEGFDIADYRYRFLTQLLIPLNSCLNPAALCVGSRKFRKLFRSYLFLTRYYKVHDLHSEQNTAKIETSRF